MPESYVFYSSKSKVDEHVFVDPIYWAICELLWAPHSWTKGHPG